MTADYLDDGSTRKKYLAPLVVVMLCAVALTGAAYAYSTTVTGNGDIKGEYTIIDIYEKTGTGTYDATSKFDILQNTLTFYTETNKTGNTVSYRAYLDGDSTGYAQLTYKTYLRINTSNTGSPSQQFKIDSFKLTYNEPENCGSLFVNGHTSGDEYEIPGDGVHIYTDESKGQGTEVENWILTENTVYYVEITINVMGGIIDATTQKHYFCDEDSFEKVQTKVNSFSSSAKELTIKITASEADTGTASNDGSS